MVVANKIGIQIAFIFDIMTYDFEKSIIRLDTNVSYLVSTRQACIIVLCDFAGFSKISCLTLAHHTETLNQHE